MSFVDEGVAKVLSVFQDAASMNTLFTAFTATFTDGRAIAGGQVPGQPLPDHDNHIRTLAVQTGPVSQRFD